MGLFGSSSDNSLKLFEAIVEEKRGRKLSEIWSQPERLLWKRLCLLVWENEDAFPRLQWIETTQEMYLYRDTTLWKLRGRKPIAAYDVDKDMLLDDGRIAELLEEIRL